MNTSTHVRLPTQDDDQTALAYMTKSDVALALRHALPLTESLSARRDRAKPHTLVQLGEQTPTCNRLTRSESALDPAPVQLGAEHEPHRPLRILVAEDDNVSRLLLRTTIDRLGHVYLMAADGLQAWALFTATEVDVVISDRLMPGLDGIELCRRVRAFPRDNYTYFIFLTALSAKADLLTGIEAGADDYLTKPFDPDELRVRLLAATRIISMHRQLLQQKAELEGLNTQLSQQARSDPLTQVGNRLRLREDLESLLGRSKHQSDRYCAIMCDIDSFKRYNDYYGHLAGDQILSAVANAIVKNSRTGDLVYRYGGEEFLIILPGIALSIAAKIAERLRVAVEHLALPHATQEPPGVVTISAGVAELQPGVDRSLHVWLQNADAALYGAKSSGKNRVVAYDHPAYGGSAR